VSPKPSGKCTVAKRPLSDLAAAAAAKQLIK
jgi:hypothetical protein